jgi:hypothetical protein
MYATHPEMAERWEAETPKGKKLPERVVKKAFDAGVAAALSKFGNMLTDGLDYAGTPHGYPNIMAPLAGAAVGLRQGNLGQGVGAGLGALAGGHGGAALGKIISRSLAGRGGRVTQNAVNDIPFVLSMLGTLGGAVGGAKLTAPEKNAATEEIRLQLPRREYHGLDAALRSTTKGEKKAEGPNADMLAEVLRTFDEPGKKGPDVPSKNILDRDTLWGVQSNLAAGDSGSRVSGMGQDNHAGPAF